MSKSPPSNAPAPTPEPTASSTSDDIPERFAKNFTAEKFNDWHALQEMRRNLEEGYHESRNDPSHLPDDDKISPHTLLQCHRMVYYKSRNAPRENQLPDGLFKFGHDFEDYLEAFLQDLAAETDESEFAEIRNPVQIEFTEDDVTITGSTDPVLFVDGKPTALVEVKTTENIYYRKRDGAQERHLAQAHAYARGLQTQYDLDSPPQIYFVYASRENLDIVVIEEDFDFDFWNDTVNDWASEQVDFRQQDELPDTIDSDGPNGYQCGYCDFKERCGNYQPDSPKPWNIDDDDDQTADDYWYNDTATGIQGSFEDNDVKGFLPLTEYPEPAVVSHLLTYDDVKLTPTLALQYPDLVDNSIEPDSRIETLYGDVPQREVHDWVCPDCGTQIEFGDVIWDSNFSDRPKCPNCSTWLRGPTPDEQGH